MRKLTGFERIAILQTMAMLITYDKVSDGEALNRAFTLFDLVEERTAKWEEERWKLDMEQQRRHEKGY